MIPTYSTDFVVKEAVLDGRQITFHPGGGLQSVTGFVTGMDSFGYTVLEPNTMVFWVIPRGVVMRIHHTPTVSKGIIQRAMEPLVEFLRGQDQRSRMEYIEIAEDEDAVQDRGGSDTDDGDGGEADSDSDSDSDSDPDSRVGEQAVDLGPSFLHG